MKKKILIADNLQNVLEREQTILNRKTFEIFTTMSGHEALSIHKEKRVDLMILSLDLADLSGDRLCSAIRKAPGLNQVSIILTCKKEPSSIQRASSCGANAYMTKPFHSSQLTEKVTKLMSIPERRSYRTLIKVSVEGLDSLGAFFCTSHNISSTGIMVETERLFEKGTLLSCSFVLPEYGRITANGEVRRVDTGGPVPRYGIQFNYLEPRLRKAIKTFVADRSDKNP